MSEYVFFNDESRNDEPLDDPAEDFWNAMLANVSADQAPSTSDASEPASQARQEPTRTGKLVSTRASDIEYKPIEFLWQDRIPVGALTLLVGDPGTGKSTLECLLAAELSTGALTGTPGTTLILNSEDNPSSIIQPRLVAAGADLDRVETVDAHEDGFPVPAYFPNLTADLAKLITEKEAKLVIIDPMLSYLDSKINAFKDQSVRKALRPLHDIAEASNTAIVMVTHLNKTVGHDTPLHRIGGSVGIPGVARSVLLFANDPKDPDGEQGDLRVLAHVKNNFGRKAASLSYRFETQPIRSHDGQTIGMLKPLGEINYTPSDLIESTEPPRERDTAKAFINEQLAGGNLAAAEIEKRATAANISKRTLDRAKDSLGVRSVRNGIGWDWTLKPVEAAEDESAPF